MTAHQAIASDPGHSSWVSASAGTGKTKVLTDRVLRLLLRGVPPARILCLTYTRAAAAEMLNRLQTALARWATADTEALARELAALLNGPDAVDESTMRRARTLFARVLESADGVRIQTIHALCQYLLRRFPLEAGVDPHFSVADERSARDMLHEARLRLFNRSRELDAPHLAEAIRELSGRYGEQAFSGMLKEIIALRRELQDLILRPSGAIHLNMAAYEALGLPYGASPGQLLEELAAHVASARKQWRAAADILSAGGARDRGYAASIAGYLSGGAESAALLSVFLTARNEPRKDLAAKPLQKLHPWLEPFLRGQQRWMQEFRQRMMKLETARRSEHLIALAESLLALYQRMKDAKGLLDYDDLILKTRGLLSQQGIAPWVLYKLDGGIDHLLVDEAQDTSPGQWEIVQALTGDFFSGESARSEVGRTMFAVGDEKQSIYSFQGADPLAFQAMRSYFSRHIEGAGESFRPVSLFTSFRSTEPVLRAVDAVFSSEEAKDGVVFAEAGSVKHEAHRNRHAGKVELWPLVRPLPRGEREEWPVAGAYQYVKSPSWRLADLVAETIQAWLRDKRLLAARGRPVRPQDIMILVRRRDAFVDELIAALKRRRVPVAGVDRLRLLDNVAVQDMLSLARFLLLPQDDLSLAELLKSPLFGISEEDLFALAHGRGDASLWQELRDHGGKPEFARACAQLSRLLGEVDYISPYDLFSLALEEYDGGRAFASRLGEEISDPLHEFLEQALVYEQSHPPSMQGFVHWLERGDAEIKRDLEQPDGKVRVLTAHGTKGLQAPVVLLPDTAAAARPQERIVKAEHEGWPYFLLLSSGDEEDSLSRRLKAESARRQMQEYRRLLYVAMTRAEDELYICGCQNREGDIPPDCWYSLAEKGLRPVAAPEPFREGEAEWQGSALLRLESAQSDPVTAEEEAREKPAHAELPAFARRPAPEEPAPPRPLVPSRSEEGPADVIPSAAAAMAARGRLIHTLLQYLPGLAPARRDAAARDFLRLRCPEAAAEEADATVKEVLGVLNYPGFREIFGPGSLAEAPITGVVSDGDGRPRVISGQIDRLAVTEKEVLVLDYKTGQRVPGTASEVPARYVRQMDGYRRLLERIYPGRAVRCALLWTAGPAIIPLNMPESGDCALTHRAG